jgi:hypothetical protein
MRCDAGLVEVAVPIQAGGIRVGYLVFGGVADRVTGRSEARRAMRVLTEHGIAIPEEILAADLSEVPVVPEQLRESYARLAAMAAATLGRLLTERLAEPPEGMPAVVARACALVRKSAFHGSVRWPEVAKACGLSEGHLSRVFRRSTGLTFPEYVGRLRAEGAFHDGGRVRGGLPVTVTVPPCVPSRLRTSGARVQTGAPRDAGGAQAQA